VALQFTVPKLVKYWTGSAFAESQDFGYIKIWNGSAWQYVDIRPYADVSEETQTVTVGSLIFKGIESYGFNSGVYGSISDGTFGFISNATINALVWSNAVNSLSFALAGNRANSGWSTVTINGIAFNRSSATYSYDSGSNTTSWSISGANPFGTTDGVTRAAVFAQ
jgi:hypothetical protein